MGNKWTIFCGTRALCSELQADVGGSINASADQPPETTTATTMAEAPLDEQVAYTAQRWILEGFGQPADGSFKNVPCTDEDPDMMRYCWASYINNFTFKDGTLYVHMDTDWTQQPDGARMVTAQNTIRNLLKNGPAFHILRRHRVDPPLDRIVGIGNHESLHLCTPIKADVATAPHPPPGVTAFHFGTSTVGVWLGI